MASEWKYWSMLVAPEADVAGLNADIAAGVDPDGGGDTLSVGLNASGSGSPTHRWCKSRLRRDGGVAALVQLAPSYPNTTAYVWSEDADAHAELATLFADHPNVHVGEVTPDQVLQNHGLQRITS